MANKHRRHSSVDTLGWMYTNRARDEAPPSLNRSLSSQISSFAFPTLKRQSSIRFHPGEYFTGCFGPRDSGHDSERPILNPSPSTPAPIPPRRPPRSRSISLGNFEFDLGSMRFKEKPADPLAARAVELNQQAATHKIRVVQPGGRWVMEDDAEYYLKPPAWKQALRKLRAEAKRHVHPVRELSPVNYDAESYEKNFDDGGRAPIYMVVEEDADEFGVKARIRHSKLLTRLHSHRFEGDPAAMGTKLVKTTSVPAVLPVKASKCRDDGVPIWERRGAGRPIAKLELTRSI